MSPTSARAAVFGIPNDEFGEEVKLAGYELSRSIDVEAALSRQARRQALQAPPPGRVRVGRVM